MSLLQRRRPHGRRLVVRCGQNGTQRVNNGNDNVADMTEYLRRVGVVPYVGNLLVNSGEDFEGETYISCRAHGLLFDVSEVAEMRGQGIVELVGFIWQHREC